MNSCWYIFVVYLVTQGFVTCCLLRLWGGYRASKRDNASDALCLAKVAQTIRRNLFDEHKPFKGIFAPNCQTCGVPTSLVGWICIILEGPNKKSQTACPTSQATLIIVLLLKFNGVKQMKQNMIWEKHMEAQESPLPLFIGNMFHSCSRKEYTLSYLDEMGDATAKVIDY